MGHSGEIAGRYTVRPLFPLFWGFLLCRNSLHRFWGVILWCLWVGRARHPRPGSLGVSVELFNVGGWLTHGDFGLESSADFLAVVEHRLIPARVRGEWSRLRRSVLVLSGLLPVKRLLMLVMLVLVLLA